MEQEHKTPLNMTAKQNNIQGESAHARSSKYKTWQEISSSNQSITNELNICGHKKL